MVLPVLAIAGSALALRAMRPKQMSLGFIREPTRRKKRTSKKRKAARIKVPKLPRGAKLDKARMRAQPKMLMLGDGTIVADWRKGEHHDQGAIIRRSRKRSRKRQYTKATSHHAPRKRTKAELHALRLANLAKARAARKRKKKHARKYKQLPPKALCRTASGRIKKHAPKKMCRTKSGRFRKTRR